MTEWKKSEDNDKNENKSKRLENIWDKVSLKSWHFAKSPASFSMYTRVSIKILTKL